MDFLIEQVRKHPCLWNMNHSLYRDIEQKDLIWERVAKDCNMECGNDAKYQWKKLRNSHREALRRRKNGPVSLNRIPWKYEEHMKFLVSEMEYDTQDSNSYIYTYTHKHDNSTVNTNNIQTLFPLPESLPRTPSPAESATMSRKDKIAVTMEQLIEERQKRQNEPREITNSSKDALANLFDSFCQKTRNLPKPLQLRVQREVFEIVIKAEEEALSYD